MKCWVAFIFFFLQGNKFAFFKKKSYVLLSKKVLSTCFPYVLMLTTLCWSVVFNVYWLIDILWVSSHIIFRKNYSGPLLYKIDFVYLVRTFMYPFNSSNTYCFLQTKEFVFTTNLLVSKIRTAVVCNLRFSALAVFLMVEDITKGNFEKRT